MYIFVLCLVAASPFVEVSSVTVKDLSKVFQTPVKKDYDQLQILERAGFETDPESVNQVIEKPKSYANAQVMLRFGNDEKKCGCQRACQCFQTIPFVFPYVLPPPCSSFYNHKRHRQYRKKENRRYGLGSNPIPNIDAIKNNFRQNDPSIIDDIADIIRLDSTKPNNNDDKIVIVDISNDDNNNAQNDPSSQTNVEQNVNINNGGFQINNQQSDLLNIENDSDSDDSTQTNINENLNINVGGLQINNQKDILLNNDDDDDSDDDNDDEDSDSISNESDDDSTQTNFDTNININTGGLQINNQQADLSNVNYDNDDDDDDDDDDDTTQTNINDNININTGGIQINNQPADLVNVEIGNDNDNDKGDISFHLSTDNEETVFPDDFNIDSLADNQNNYNLADLFEPQNPNNPIIITFEKASPKLLDIIAQQLNLNSDSDDNDKRLLVDLFQPNNPKNPIIRTFERAKTTFLQNIFNKLSSSNKFKPNSLLFPIGDINSNPIQNIVNQQLLNQYYSNPLNNFNSQKQLDVSNLFQQGRIIDPITSFWQDSSKIIVPDYNPNVVSYPFYQNLPEISTLNPGILSQNFLPSSIINNWSQQRQFENPFKSISEIQINDPLVQVINSKNQVLSQNIAPAQIVSPNGQIIDPSNLLNIIDPSKKIYRNRPSTQVADCQCVLTKL